MSRHNQALISMEYWYPIIQSIGMRVPETIFVHYPYGQEIWHMLDGEKPKGFDELKKAIDAAARQIGYPVFIRTDHSSDKHSWKDTCYLVSKEDITQHVGGLVEHSAMADWPCDFFVVRRMIETNPICTAFYGEMPVAKERRVFAKDGKVICNHPYWPTDALVDESVTVEQIKELQAISDEDLKETNLMAEYVSKYIPEAWSIDFLQDKDGKWWLIDMALAESSYHWPTCENRSLQIVENLITGEKTPAVQEKP